MKKTLSMYRTLIKVVLSLSLLSAVRLSYALPFAIVPATTLPTTITPGNTVQASYTVTNNTGSTRHNNYVKYLPLNVTAASGGCMSNFNLGPHGSSTDHCTLNLTISGAVNGNDSDPHHHLFVCFPGGVTCAGTAFPLNISVTPQPSPFPGELNGISCIGSHCIAVGADAYFNTNAHNGTPLAYTSNNGGSTWVLSSPFILPGGDQELGNLNSVSCVDNNCTAVGNSFNRVSDGVNSINLPLAYSSNNGGSTWVISSPLTLPSGQTQGRLNGVSCAGSHCTAVGESWDNGRSTLPVVYTSDNGGSIWVLSLTSPLPLPAGQSIGSLASVSCVGINCTAVGYSTDSSGSQALPLAYTSNNGGSTWILSLTSPLPLPDDQPEGSLSSVSCVGSNCTAVGYARSGYNQMPLAYISDNGGRTWALSLTSPFPLPVNQTGGWLKGISCLDTHCTAVGHSSNSNYDTLPLAYISNNSGNIWVLSSTFDLPNSSTTGSLHGVSCVDSNNCTAGGVSFEGEGINLPLAYTRSNNGSTWILSPPLPNIREIGALLNVWGKKSTLGRFDIYPSDKKWP